MKKNEQFVSVNVGILEAAFSADAIIGIEELIARGLVRSKSRRIKILGEGDISKSLVIKAHAFSKGAQEKIEKSGGRIELIGKGRGPLTRRAPLESRGVLGRRRVTEHRFLIREMR